MSVRVFYDILNQKGTPAMYTDTFANRPAFGYQGRLFISTDSGQIFEDTGSAWTLVADAGVGGGTLSSVCLNGNTTASGIVITAGGLSTNSLTNTSLTTGSILFADGGGLITQSNASFFWDNTNKRLGIGTSSPGAPLDIHGTGTQIQINGTGANNSYIQFQNAGVNKWRIGNNYNGATNSFDIYNSPLASTALSFNNINNIATFSSIVKTNQALAIQELSTSYIVSGYTTINAGVSGSTNQIILNWGNGNQTSLLLTNTSNRAFNFPSSDGTLALTSDLSNYVSLATIQTISGAKTFSSGTKFDLGLFLKESTSSGRLSGYVGISATSTGSMQQLQFLYPVSGSSIFSLPTVGSYNYEFPTASGTLALTSDITSAINGTTNKIAKFTSTNVIGNSMLSDDGTTLTSLGATRSNFYIKAANNTYYSQLAFANGTNASTGGISYNNSGQYMQFETNTSEWMRLTSGGNVLIGTTTDNGNKLQVNGTAYFLGNVGIGTSTTPATFNVKEGGASGAPLFRFFGNASNGEYMRGAWYASDTTTHLAQLTVNGTANMQFGTVSSTPLIFTTADTERMRITSGGELLLNTTSIIQSGLFSLQGNTTTYNLISMKDTGTAAAGVYYMTFYNSSNGLAGGINHLTASTVVYYTGPSDERLKSNIKDIKESVLPLFDDVKLKTYNHIADEDESIIYKGFLAQEMVDKFPEAYGLDKDGYYQYNPNGYIPYLVKAISELSQQNQKLNNKLVRNNIN